MEKTIEKETVYSGALFDLELYTVETYKGTISEREIIKHGVAVVIIGITNEKKLVLAKQFRKAVEKNMLEFPAGRVEVGEDNEKAAIREFKEETGYTLDNPRKLVEFYSSPGFCNEKLILFVGEANMKGDTDFDDDEFIETYEFSIGELKDAIKKGLIDDGKTILGTYMYESLMGEKNV